MTDQIYTVQASIMIDNVVISLKKKDFTSTNILYNVSYLLYHHDLKFQVSILKNMVF